MALRPSSNFGTDNPTLNFYKKKSIVNSFNFSVGLDFAKHQKYAGTVDIEQPLYFYLGNIEEHHFLSIDFPFNSFSRESVNVGTMQYSIPVLSKEQPLDIRITLEEDDRANVAGLIHTLQNTIVDTKGYHQPILFSRLGDIYVHIKDSQGQIIGLFKATDVFFLGASGGFKGSYDTSESIKYDLTFGTDYIEYFPSNGPEGILPAKKFPLFNLGALAGTAAIAGAGMIANNNRKSSVDPGQTSSDVVSGF